MLLLIVVVCGFVLFVVVCVTLSFEFGCCRLLLVVVSWYCCTHVLSVVGLRCWCSLFVACCCLLLLRGLSVSLFVVVIIVCCCVSCSSCVLCF